MNTPARSLLLLLALHCAATAADWPMWRGPNGDGTTAESKLPLKWSITENVVWMTPLHEPGNSTPVVSKGRVFITQAIGKERLLQCHDRASGKRVWQQGVTEKE